MLPLGCGVALASDINTDTTTVATVATNMTLKVATLNIAHGRKDGMNQMLQSGATARQNLQDVARLLDRIGADVVALQEADGSSRWSGNFDHVDVVAEAASYPFRVHGLHAKKALYQFGTALLSRYPFQRTLSHSFTPSPPTTTKGFDVGVIAWNPGGNLASPVLVHAVSVHLDFSRDKVRDQQVAELVSVLGKISEPLVVMGDFNSDAEDDDSPLRNLARKLDLQLFRPDADGLSTYGSSGSRLDWILLSRQLDYVDHKIWPDVVSDHRAVVAEISLAAD